MAFDIFVMSFMSNCLILMSVKALSEKDQVIKWFGLLFVILATVLQTVMLHRVM